MLPENINFPSISVKLNVSVVSYITSFGPKFCSDVPGIMFKKFPPKRLEEAILAEESSGIFISLLTIIFTFAL